MQLSLMVYNVCNLDYIIAFLAIKVYFKIRHCFDGKLRYTQYSIPAISTDVYLNFSSTKLLIDTGNFICPKSDCMCTVIKIYSPVLEYYMRI